MTTQPIPHSDSEQNNISIQLQELLSDYDINDRDFVAMLKLIEAYADRRAEKLVVEARQVNGETSDGYHTFNELYRYRMLYHASYANLVHFYEQQHGGTEKPVKSWKHSDGELCFGGGWFVVSQQLPTGQITNHYEAKDWDLFQIPEVETAPEYDGHTPQEAADRLEAALTATKEEAQGE